MTSNTRLLLHATALTLLTSLGHGQSFGPPTLVADRLVNAPGADNQSVSLNGDGTRLMLSSDRTLPGRREIFEFMRLIPGAVWQPAPGTQQGLSPLLSPSGEEWAVSLSADGLVVLLSSSAANIGGVLNKDQRASGRTSDMFLFYRRDLFSQWVSELAFTGRTSSVLDVVNTPDYQYAHHLSVDGLELVYAALSAGAWRLHRATRASAQVPFQAGVVIPELALAQGTASYTQTRDGRMALFAAFDGQQWDLVLAMRPTAMSAFTTTRRVAELSTSVHESGVAICEAEGSVYFSRFNATTRKEEVWSSRLTREDVGVLEPLALQGLPQTLDMTTTPEGIYALAAGYANGNWDLYEVRRARATDPWGTPAPVATLNSTAHEYGPSLTADGLLVAFNSDRVAGQWQDIYLAERANRAQAFGPPSTLYTANLNHSGPDNDDVTAWLSPDGLTIVYAVRGGVGRDYELMTSTRASRTAAFPLPALLVELNTASHELGPCLLDGGRTIVFASGRNGGVFELFAASRTDTSSPFGPVVPFATVSQLGGSGVTYYQPRFSAMEGLLYTGRYSSAQTWSTGYAPVRSLRAPSILRLGGNTVFRMDGPAGGWALLLGAPLLATSPARLAGVFGALELRADVMFNLGWTTTDTLGVASWSLPFPCVAELSGLVLAFQALVGPLAGSGAQATRLSELVTLPMGLGAPRITAFAAQSGPYAGGTQVSFRAACLVPPVDVELQGQRRSAVATPVAGTDEYDIQFVTRACTGSPGCYDVTLHAPSGSVSTLCPSGFTYLDPPPPTLTGISPTVVATGGGETVMIDGTNFVPGQTSIMFGSVAGTDVQVEVQGTRLTVRTPPHFPGAVNVTVRTTSAQNVASCGSLCFRFDPPQVTALVPSCGTVLGGTAVTVHGVRFTSSTVISLNGQRLTNQRLVSSAQITGNAPPGPANGGWVAATADDGYGSSATPSVFEYKPLGPVLVMSVTPTVQYVEAGQVSQCGLSGDVCRYKCLDRYNIFVLQSSRDMITTFGIAGLPTDVLITDVKLNYRGSFASSNGTGTTRIRGSFPGCSSTCSVADGSSGWVTIDLDAGYPGVLGMRNGSSVRLTWDYRTFSLTTPSPGSSNYVRWSVGELSLVITYQQIICP